MTAVTPSSDECGTSADDETFCNDLANAIRRCGSSRRSPTRSVSRWPICSQDCDGRPGTWQSRRSLQARCGSVDGLKADLAMAFIRVRKRAHDRQSDDVIGVDRFFGAGQDVCREWLGAGPLRATDTSPPVPARVAVLGRSLPSQQRPGFPRSGHRYRADRILLRNTARRPAQSPDEFCSCGSLWGTWSEGRTSVR